MHSVIAVDLGATNLRTAIISPEGKMKCFSHRPVGTVSSGAEVTEIITEMIRETIKDANVQPDAIGIATAGPVNLEKGTVVHPPNMTVDEIPLRNPIEEEFNIPTVMVTDCKAGVYGEYTFGSAKGTKNLVYLTFSTGIGAGVIADGMLLQGKDGNAGEVGHITVDSRYFAECGCHRYGHWEAYASGSGIPKFFSIWKQQRGIPKDTCPFQTAEEILCEAKHGNQICSEFATEINIINSRGLSAIVCAYNPEQIILDGPIAREYFPLLFRGTDSYLDEPNISVSILKGNAPLMGAGALAFKLAK